MKKLFILIALFAVVNIIQAQSSYKIARNPVTDKAEYEVAPGDYEAKQRIQRSGDRSDTSLDKDPEAE